MTINLPSGRTGQALAVAMTFALLAILWLAIASPLIGWYDQRADALATRTMEAARLSRLAASLPALERADRRLAKATPARKALWSGETNAIAGAALQQAIQTMAGRTGAALSSAETLPAQKAGPYWRIRLRVAVSGSWPVLIHLLRSITTGQPAMLVDDLRLTSADMAAVKTAPKLNALFTVIAFRRAAHPNGVHSGKPDRVER